jgi:hypothetical protein
MKNNFERLAIIFCLRQKCHNERKRRGVPFCNLLKMKRKAELFRKLILVNLKNNRKKLEKYFLMDFDQMRKEKIAASKMDMGKEFGERDELVGKSGTQKGERKCWRGYFGWWIIGRGPRHPLVRPFRVRREGASPP